MMLTRRAALSLPFVAAGAARAQGTAWAPDRPLRMVVTVPPGGSTDVSARLLAQASVVPFTSLMT